MDVGLFLKYVGRFFPKYSIKTGSTDCFWINIKCHNSITHCCTMHKHTGSKDLWRRRGWPRGNGGGSVTNARARHARGKYHHVAGYLLILHVFSSRSMHFLCRTLRRWRKYTKIKMPIHERNLRRCHECVNMCWERYKKSLLAYICYFLHFKFDFYVCFLPCMAM